VSRTRGYDAVVEGMPQTATEAPVCVPASESKRLPCDLCGTPMEPEHAHDKCPACHYILPCCGW
jgi:rubrerythrin